MRSLAAWDSRLSGRVMGPHQGWGLWVRGLEDETWGQTQARAPRASLGPPPTRRVRSGDAPATGSS